MNDGRWDPSVLPYCCNECGSPYHTTMQHDGCVNAFQAQLAASRERKGIPAPDPENLIRVRSK